jgi:hypothetical protein
VRRDGALSFFDGATGKPPFSDATPAGVRAGEDENRSH